MEQSPKINESLKLPTPTQLHKLSTVALAAAQRANRLRFYDERLEPVYGWVEQYNYSDNENDRRYERFSGRRARRVFTTLDEYTQQEDVAFYADRWSLRYREIRQQHVAGEFWLSQLKTYAFEWDREDVILSLCQTKEVPSIEAGEVERVMALNDDDLEELSMTPTDASTVVVDQGQLAELTGSIRKRYAAMPVRETRAEARRRATLQRVAKRHQHGQSFMQVRLSDGIALKADES